MKSIGSSWSAECCVSLPHLTPRTATDKVRLAAIYKAADGESMDTKCRYVHDLQQTSNNISNV